MKGNDKIIKEIVKENLKSIAEKQKEERFWDKNEIALEKTRKAKSYLKSLEEILKSSINAPVNLWDLIQPQLLLPNKPEISQPEYLPIPSKEKFKLEEMPSYKLKPKILPFEEAEPKLEDYKEADISYLYTRFWIGLVVGIIVLIYLFS